MELDLKAFEEKLTEVKKSLEGSIEKMQKETSDKAVAEVATLKAELDATKKTINSLEEQMKAAKAMTVPGLKDELKSKPFSWTLAVAGMYRQAKSIFDGNPMNTDAAFGQDGGYELEIIKEYAKKRNSEQVSKANYASDGTAGGYLIPPEVTNEVGDMAIANMPLMTMGVNPIRGLVGELPIPRKTGRCPAYWVGENEAPTGGQVAYGETTLRPKKAAAFTKQSNRLIYQSRGVSDRLIKQDIADSMALHIESGLLNGTGSDKQPLGILNQKNVTTFTSSGVALSSARFRIDHASKMLMNLDVANEFKPGGAYGLLTRPEVVWGMKRERVTQYNGQAASAGAPIMAMNLLMTNEMLSSQIGIKIATTSLFPKDSGASTTQVLIGDFKQFYIGFWRDFVLKVSDVAGDGSTGSAFLQDQMYIVAFQEVDCAVMRGTAFCLGTGAETDEDKW